MDFVLTRELIHDLNLTTYIADNVSATAEPYFCGNYFYNITYKPYWLTSAITDLVVLENGVYGDPTNIGEFDNEIITAYFENYIDEMDFEVPVNLIIFDREDYNVTWTLNEEPLLFGLPDVYISSGKNLAFSTSFTIEQGDYVFLTITADEATPITMGLILPSV